MGENYHVNLQSYPSKEKKEYAHWLINRVHHVGKLYSA